MGLSPLSYRPPLPILFLLALFSSPTFSPFCGSSSLFSPPLFFSLFRAPVGRPLLLSSVTPWPAFLPPGLFFTLCAVRRSPRRLLCRPSSASGAFMSDGLRPPFLGLLVPDRSLPWPPCARVASLAARRTGSLAALWASSLAARCAACLAARRAGSLTAQSAACFAAQCAACFAARGVACFAAPCAASLAASRAAFLDAPYVGSFPARPVASLAAQAGPPSSSVFSRLRLPFKGALFSAPFLAWYLPLATSLHRFFTSLFLFRSHLLVAPSSWVLHTSGLTGMGTRAPHVLPPPSGTFRLLETRQYVTTD